MRNVRRIRKSIDITPDTKRLLSHRATNKDVSLKNYELIVEQAAEQEEDEMLIELSSQPEGILTGKEKEQFKKYLQSLRGE